MKPGHDAPSCVVCDGSNAITAAPGEPGLCERCAAHIRASSPPAEVRVRVERIAATFAAARLLGVPPSELFILVCADRLALTRFAQDSDDTFAARVHRHCLGVDFALQLPPGSVEGAMRHLSGQSQ